MYSPGDAVAKVDGYIISVRGGTPYVGREAPGADRGGRPHAAVASLVDVPRRPTDAAADGRFRGRARIEASAPRPQRRTAPFGRQGRIGRGGILGVDHVRNRQNRRQAIPRRGGPVPARRAAARGRRRDGRRWSRCSTSTAPTSSTARTSAEVTVRLASWRHERGPKLRIVKFKPKRGYKRRTGHRQELTRIEVTEIKLGAAKRSGAKAVADSRARRSLPPPPPRPRRRLRWRIRRASAHPATAATPTPSASASRCSPARR